MADGLNKYFNILQGIFEEVLKTKNSGEERANVLAEKRKQGALQFVVIKKLNRQAKYDLRAGRDKLHSEKLLVDSNRLQLQNLLYEVSHLKREIKRCHKFKSQDEDIELLAVEDYVRILQPVELPSTVHEKRIARLGWELQLRKQLADQCKELLNSKKEVCQDIVSRMDRLSSFTPSLRLLLKATQPLQEALQLPLEQEWKLKQLVQLLPQPLFLAYMNIHAAERLFDKEVLCTTVYGASEEEVHQADIEQQIEELKQRYSGDIDESEVVSAKKRRHDNMENAMELLRKRFLEPHPLIVRFVFKDLAQTNEQFQVELRYFPRMGILTAVTQVNSTEADSTSELQILQNLLNVLYMYDTGDELPVTCGQLSLFDMTPDKYMAYLLAQNYGRPYRWLQRMCNLEAYGQQETVTDCKHLMVTISKVIERIHLLWLCRRNLIRQIKALMAKNIDLYLKDEVILPTVRPACTLVQWTTVSWEEYSQDVSTADYISNGYLVNKHQLFYRAVIVRGSAKMECLINVPTLFPYDNSQWAVCIHWNGEHNASNNPIIRMLEQYVNELTQKKLQNESALLAAQLVRTMHCFDIYLETESTNHDPAEFAKEKHFVHAVGLRSRIRPFRHFEGTAENMFVFYPEIKSTLKTAHTENEWKQADNEITLIESDDENEVGDKFII